MEPDTPMTTNAVLTLEEQPLPYEVRTEITITQKESQIFAFILGVLQEHNRNTVCRVAGGWVRDKLMGKSSDDIDIALDDMFGEELAEMLRAKIY